MPVADDDLRASLAEDPLLRLVSLAGNLTAQRFTRVMGRQRNLTAAGASVLSVLAWGAGRSLDKGTPGRATHAQLARRCWIAPGTLTGIIDTLEKAGYVRRERDAKDRRVVWLVATEAGEEQISDLGRQLYETLGRTRAEQDPAKEAIVREYLIELIMSGPEMAGECAPPTPAQSPPAKERRQRGDGE